MFQLIIIECYEGRGSCFSFNRLELNRCDAIAPIACQNNQKVNAAKANE